VQHDALLPGGQPFGLPQPQRPGRRVEDRQIVVAARTGKLVAGSKRSGYGMTLDDVAERLGK
jgi:hypothetical protein